MKRILKILKFSGEAAVFWGTLFLVFCLAYYFGWSLLVGKSDWGNDAPFAMSFISYLARWYPPIPSWNYAWGGGMPFLSVYPPLPTLVTFFFHRLTNLPVQQIMRFLFWFSIPLAATGVASLGRLVSKNWWVGILAGMMMILSPDSWLWISHGGFYAFSLSVPVFAWALVVFFLALEKQKKSFWIFSIIFYSLTWLFHPMAGVMLTLVLLILGIGRGRCEKERIWRDGIRTLSVIIGGSLLIAYWLIPFYFFRQNQGIGVSPEQMAYVTFKELAGLEFAHDGVYITSTFFTASVAILFIVGSFAAFLRKSPIRFLVIASFLAIFIMTAPGYARQMTALFIRFWESTGVRATLILRVLAPIIAGYGAVSIIRPVFWGIERGMPKLKRSYCWKITEIIVSGIFGSIIFFWLLKTVIVIPPFPGNQRWYYRGFGPVYSWLDLELKNGEIFARGRKLFPSFLETAKKVITGDIEVDFWESDWEKLIKTVSSETNLSHKERIEIIPFSGMITGTLTNCSEATQISPYVGISLIPRMIGWQVTCFYYGDFCGPIEVEDLARWYGISWIWLGSEGTKGPASEKITQKIDQSKLFESKKLNFWVNGVLAEWNAYQFQDSTGLASISNKPAILVIGDNPPNNDVFDTVFRGLSKINFGYKEAWSVKGKRFVDDYQLEELKQFEMLILHGYQYHNKEKAWSLLEKYVNQGGKIFVNTGWQYMTPDWGKEIQGKFVEIEMPEIFPVRKTLWGDIGYQWNLKLADHPVSEGVGTENWGKPIWEKAPWGMALAKESWLRTGAVPLLANQDKILVASMDYGKGKIIWTGFDFWGHLFQYGNSDEKLFLENLFSYLLLSKGDVWEERLDFERVEPDLIRVSFTKPGERRKLLFKEVASENWARAQLEKRKLSVYRAGPGWKMVFLPDEITRGEVVFKYRLVWHEILGRIISILTLIFLILYLLGKTEKVFLKIERKIEDFFQKKFERLKKEWEKDGY